MIAHINEITLLIPLTIVCDRTNAVNPIAKILLTEKNTINGFVKQVRKEQER
jgi:hypothetical protein